MRTIPGFIWVIWIPPCHPHYLIFHRINTTEKPKPLVVYVIHEISTRIHPGDYGTGASPPVSRLSAGFSFSRVIGSGNHHGATLLAVEFAGCAMHRKIARKMFACLGFIFTNFFIFTILYINTLN